jgi:hypothetical protein
MTKADPGIFDSGLLISKLKAEPSVFAYGLDSLASFLDPFDLLSFLADEVLTSCSTCVFSSSSDSCFFLCFL